MTVAVFALIFAALFGPVQAMEFIETPSLEPLVKEGKLPPVAERVRRNPIFPDWKKAAVRSAGMAVPSTR